MSYCAIVILCYEKYRVMLGQLEGTRCWQVWITIVGTGGLRSHQTFLQMSTEMSCFPFSFFDEKTVSETSIYRYYIQYIKESTYYILFW